MKKSKSRVRQKSRAVARKRVVRKVASTRRSLARRSNPGVKGAVKLSDRVEAVLYRHSWSKTRAPYRHDFGGGVRLYGLPDGSVLIKGSVPLWDMYTVPDNE